MNSETELQKQNINQITCCTIPKGVHIKGNIISHMDLELTGDIEGDVEVYGSLAVDGTIRGNYVKAENLDLANGVIYSDVECTGELKLGQNAVVIGNIKTGLGKIYGAVKGHIEAEKDLHVFKTAVVSGTIDATNVNIEFGVVCDIDMHDSHSDQLSLKIF